MSKVPEILNLSINGEVYQTIGEEDVTDFIWEDLFLGEKVPEGTILVNKRSEKIGLIFETKLKAEISDKMFTPLKGSIIALYYSLTSGAYTIPISRTSIQEENPMLIQQCRFPTKEELEIYLTATRV